MREWMQDPDDGAEVAEALRPTRTQRTGSTEAARDAKIKQARSEQPPPPPKTDPKRNGSSALSGSPTS